MLRLLPPKVPGKRRLARWISERSVPQWSRVVDCRGFGYDVPDAREPVAFDLAVDGVYEPATLDLILRRLPRDGVFVDVGANIGAFAMPAAAHVGPDGRVVAIEASPQVYQYLERNVSANGLRNLTCLQAAAVGVAGEVLFYPAPPDHFGMGALSPHFGATSVPVRGAQLDELLAGCGIKNVDVLKIDVEGSELGVLQGATTLLSGSHPPLVILEFCDWAEARIPSQTPGDSQRWLLEFGFSIWRLTDFLHAAPPLTRPVVHGFDMLVAERQRACQPTL